MIQLASRAALSIGLFLLLASVLLLLIVHPGTSQFVLTIIDLIIGGVLVGAGIVGVRLISRRTTIKEDQ